MVAGAFVAGGSGVEAGVVELSAEDVPGGAAAGDALVVVSGTAGDEGA